MLPEDVHYELVRERNPCLQSFEVDDAKQGRMKEKKQKKKLTMRRRKKRRLPSLVSR
jgi:hypothetical protein